MLNNRNALLMVTAVGNVTVVVPFPLLVVVPVCADARE